MSRQHERGMTLMETVIVLAILSILMGGVALGNRMIDEWRFKCLVHQVADTIKYTQEEASYRNVIGAVWIDPTGVRQKCVVNIAGEESQSFDLPKDMAVKIEAWNENTSWQDRKIAFYGDLTPAGAKTVTLTAEKLNKKVELTIRVATGKISIREVV